MMSPPSESLSTELLSLLRGLDKTTKKLIDKMQDSRERLVRVETEIKHLQKHCTEHCHRVEADVEKLHSRIDANKNGDIKTYKDLSGQIVTNKLEIAKYMGAGSIIGSIIGFVFAMLLQLAPVIAKGLMSHLLGVN